MKKKKCEPIEYEEKVLIKLTKEEEKVILELARKLSDSFEERINKVTTIMKYLIVYVVVLTFMLTIGLICTINDYLNRVNKINQDTGKTVEKIEQVIDRLEKIERE